MFDAIILAIIQGLTEFLPVSSSGHLVIVRDMLKFEVGQSLAFDAVLHLATLGAVMLYFSKDLWVLGQSALRLLGRLPVHHTHIILLKSLGIATIPAAVFGYFLEDIIELYFNEAWRVAVVLCVAAFFFMYAEWRQYARPHVIEAVSVKRAWWIGVFQILALLPGFSRSGATIAGGMLMGLSRYEATRFSFLMSIPIIAGVGTKKLVDLLAMSAEVNWGVIAVASAVAFVVALFVIHFFLQFVRKYTLWPFIWYTLIMAGLVGYYYLVG